MVPLLLKTAQQENTTFLTKCSPDKDIDIVADDEELRPIST